MKTNLLFCSLALLPMLSAHAYAVPKASKETRDAIMKSIVAHQGDFSNCYTQSESATKSRVKLTVLFTVNEDGSVKKASPADVTPHSDSVAQCVVALVKGIQFDPHTGGALEIKFPFKFDPAASNK